MKGSGFLLLKIQLSHLNKPTHSHIGKDPDAGKDRSQKEKKAAKEEMVMASLIQWT